MRLAIALRMLAAGRGGAGLAMPELRGSLAAHSVTISAASRRLRGMVLGNEANCSSYVLPSPNTVRRCRAGPLRPQAIAGVRYPEPATVPPQATRFMKT